ncbi:MerR family transcriptional regulator [Variovorax ginsengisoli]|uniref:DNA-binding transcriptional MerR regulator n=1 Tax=Variovorax ginsengisoli TaxID=363844 RepID=A0ABT9SD10_9BURK|nr:MerR family transcriptional regulator [Variovorax ginsengisoli]MDP9902243.1 DNA-binding transcriptional MerR regulator [Variovorax ginsengisoli]
MNASVRFLSPAQAARQLGVSAKALRLYEQHGMVTPTRNTVGWRTYGPDDMQRGGDIVALRSLGLSLAQVAGVLRDEPTTLQPALAAHQGVLESRARQLAVTIEKVKGLRARLDHARAPTAEKQAHVQDAGAGAGVEFELPWPWGGELFKLDDIRPLNYIVGPLGSGKTRLALRLAEVLPAASFLSLERARISNGVTARLGADPDLRLRVQQTMADLVGHGANASAALVALLVGLEAQDWAALVVDLVEQGLDLATQQAVAAHLRRRRSDARPLFLLTRSSVILDLPTLGADASIILCPANHSPPTRVAPYPGTPGYEAVSTCLADPAVRARTEGVIAWRPLRQGVRHAVRPANVGNKSQGSG